MERKTKIILIASSIVLVGVIAVVLIYFKNKRDEREAAEKKEAEEKAKTEEQKKIESEYYVPKFNRNGELINSVTDLKKVILRTKNENVNLRSSPEINNLGAWYDLSTNLVAKAKKNSVLGTVVSEHKGKETPQMRWFKLKLEKPLVKGFSEIAGLTIATGIPDFVQYVYVRADVVTFNKTKK